MLKNLKLKNLNEAQEYRLACLRKKNKFVLTNGCFDILHIGHIYFLQKAAKKGYCLWVALNSSISVRQLKGDNRPFYSDQERAYMLAALDSVTGITIFNNQHIAKEILTLKPDIYVKASDYNLNKLHLSERNALKSINADICFLPFLQNFSTTYIMKCISLGKRIL